MVLKVNKDTEDKKNDTVIYVKHISKLKRHMDNSYAYIYWQVLTKYVVAENNEMLEI